MVILVIVGYIVRTMRYSELDDDDDDDDNYDNVYFAVIIAVLL